MTEWFVDTSYWIAFLNTHDEAHQKAVDLGNQFKGHLLTTQWVLNEFANAMSAATQRGKVIALIDWLNNNPRVTIIPADSSAFHDGFNLYRGRPDKAWSLTDCISFRIMENRKIKEALTADQHFEQAGFTALLKQGIK